jgi:hypothetical protein
MAVTKRIGIDLDNTLINYDRVFRTFAQERGLIDADFAGGKDEVRQAIRALADGELAWQRLQGAVYGRGVRDAVLFEGADVFLQRARERGCEVVIVSHKTEFGHYDPERINLRDAALEWMETKGFFREDGFAIPSENVAFAATRSEKITAICDLDVSFFIDDLPEVLEDSGFPGTVTGILFMPGTGASTTYPRAFAHWREITEMVFG